MSESSGLRPFLCSTIDPALLRVEWERWKRAFTIYAESNEITDQSKLKSKLLHLGGLELQDVFFAIPGADVQQNEEKTLNVYDTAITKLNEQFSPKRNSVFERHIFRTMKLDDGETFDRFMIRLRNQADKCAFGETADQSKEINLKDKIIDIAPFEVKKKLLEKEMKLEDMISLYNVHCQIKAQSEAMGLDKRFSSVQAVSTNEIERRQNKNNLKCFNCNLFGHISYDCRRPKQSPRDNKFQQKCVKCGSVGHSTFNCWKGGKRLASDGNQRPGSSKRFRGSSVRQIDSMESELNEAEEEFIANVGVETDDDELINCEVAGCKIRMLIDSGSKYNMVDELTWRYLRANCEILNVRYSTNKLFRAFATHELLKVKGIFEAKVVIPETQAETIATFYVIEKAEMSLLGKLTATRLGVLSVGLGIKCPTECKIHSVKRMSKEPFPKIKDVLVEISVDPNVKPVIQPLRRAPIALQDQISDKIQELLELDIIEPVKGPITWQSPLVPVLKGNGDLRLCIDMRRANEAILRENHPLPTFEDLLPLIRNARMFSRLDLKNGFHQLELHESSRYITTFISSKGVFRYKRLLFGVNCAPEIFQKVIERMLLPCSGCFNYIDDIIIYGRNAEEHNENVHKVLSVLKECNVVLNSAKCVFNVTEIDFLGHHLSAAGVSPFSSKIEALQSFRSPQTVEELKSFLGLVTYIGRFIPNLGTRTYVLRELAKSREKFDWKQKHEKSFLDIKSIITRIETLGYFDPNDKTQVIADASPFALGAVLCQEKNDQPRIITYASKSLTATEKRYCQTEKEALALVWAVERFSMYLLGLTFDLITDHRPLEAIFKPKSKPCARIERWVLRLQSFRYRVIYKKGNSNIADPLSRLYTGTNDPEFDEDCEQYIQTITDAVALDVHEIREATIQDPDLNQIKEAVTSNDWTKVHSDYIAFRNEFSVADDLILRGTKVLIPKSLQNRILELAHEGHPGETKMKMRLRNRVWFPRIDKLVQDKIKTCRGCLLVSAPSRPEPMKRRELPSRPWTDVAIDFLGPLPSGNYLFIIVDYYSRYKEIEVMTKITANDTIRRLSKIFCRLGFPRTMTLDNGRQFISEELQLYCKQNNIHLNFSAPYWPQENGEVERQNRAVLKRLKISQIYERNWKDDLMQYLTMYYATPHCTTGKPPAELMYGRQIRDKLPLLYNEDCHFGIDEEVRDKDTIGKYKQKVYVDAKRGATNSNIKVGDRVLKQIPFKTNKLTPNYNDTEYFVKEKNGAKCKIVDREGQQLIRNSAHLKKIENEALMDLPSYSQTLSSPQQTGSSSSEILPSFDVPPSSEVSSSTHSLQAESSALLEPEQPNTSIPSDVQQQQQQQQLFSNNNKPIRSRKVPLKYKDFIIEN